MAEKRPWTEQQDRALIRVFEATRVPKWSHIARRLQEEFGVKNRTGKQCKERYTTFIDPSHPKEEWCYQEELRMFQLHNEMGNKWAIIGCQLGGKSDNSVKNHFYSRLRKSLRKINKVIEVEFKKQYKEIKPSLLYRVVEVSEERFKANPAFEKDFVCFANQFKNELLEFSYDGEEEEIEDEVVNLDTARILIHKVSQFGARYKKKSKKERRASGYDQELLLNYRYDFKAKNCHSDNQQSHELVRSQGEEDNSDESLPRGQTKKVRRDSADTAASIGQIYRIRTRSAAMETLRQAHKIVSTCYFDHSKEEEEANPLPFQGNDRIEELQVEGILDGLKLLEQDENMPLHPTFMNRQNSKYSRFSQGASGEQYRFFEESQEMQMLPEIELGFRRDSQYEDSFFR